MQRNLVFYGVSLTNPSSNTLDMYGQSKLDQPLPGDFDVYMESEAIRVRYFSTQTKTYQTAGHFSVPPETKLHVVRYVCAQGV